ncbi:isoleucyl-tRNA synthetase [Ramicandelaber brevisporus]|nr:isoleucyl-tRNA synthetase [Ramicandelaber brevisporus]
MNTTSTSFLKQTDQQQQQQQQPSYSDTLLLPKTPFPLRANAAKRDHLFRDRCTKELYEWQLANNPGDLFVLHDGPPYANGPLHIGHALNKILKDIINRYQIQLGRKVVFIPGWDCHGLPIEQKALGSFSDAERTKMPPAEIRKRAEKFATEAVELQRNGLQRWSLIGDWQNPYLTMHPEYEISQLRVFRGLVEDGMVFRRNRPVYWSPSSRTALAEAELEYEEKHESKSVYVAMPIVKPASALPMHAIFDKHGAEKANVKLVVWTTTPWTLPANRAIAVHPELEYVAVRFSGSSSTYIVAHELLGQLHDTLSTDPEAAVTVLAQFPGSALLDTVYANPLTSEEHRVIVADYVTSTSGTGLVHSAPGHGMVDYEVCASQYGIQPFSPVDDDGRYTAEVGIPALVGLDVQSSGNDAVIRMLEDLGALLKKDTIVHSYPYDWRTKKPVIQRATPQWFADIGALHRPADAALGSETAQITAVPKQAISRLRGYIAQRSEWCISRQRAWGVPIPAFYDMDTGEAILTTESVDSVISALEKAGNGINGWWTMSVEELLPQHLLVRKDGSRRQLVKCFDTMDVWFDSGTSWSNLRQRLERAGHIEPSSASDKKPFVADVYSEGSDQHRGWFQSSSLLSTAIQGTVPFKTLITHGFTLDESGAKMSKSLGNVIDPEVIVSGGKDLKKMPAYGSDVLRLWVSSTDYTRDVVMGHSVMAQIGDQARKFRNTARFILGNLAPEGPQTPNLVELRQTLEGVPKEALRLVDRIALMELYKSATSLAESYNSHAFNHVFHELCRLTNSVLSAFYHDIVKDRLYASHPADPARIATLHVLYKTLNVYVRALAPIMPHLAEEIFEQCPQLLSPNGTEQLLASVGQTGWYQLDDAWNDAGVAAQWAVLEPLRASVNRTLETARANKAIRSALEASVKLVISNDKTASAASAASASAITQNAGELAELFIVSNVTVSTTPSASTDDTPLATLKCTLPGDLDVEIEVHHVKDHKCPRCWIYQSKSADHLCNRCDEVIHRH